MFGLEMRIDEVLWTAGLLVGSAVVGLVVHLVVFTVLRLLARRRRSIAAIAAARHLSQPARWLTVVIAMRLAVGLMVMPTALEVFLVHALILALIASAAWLVIRAADVLREVIVERYRVDVRDNLLARKVQTQMTVLKRITTVLVVILALGAAMMTFEEVRRLGVSLLASAGLFGLVAGIAARGTLATLFAGIQIALTQPIRLDDVVIIEGEWGRIEEITLTYVVVRIWDLRRLVVPITYFIEKPFQNWTRATADLLGTVVLYADYTVPVQAVRDELHRILKTTSNWDGKAWGLQVTNASERTVELRALMSAADASAAWDLRCHVREKLLEFLQTRHPDSLPKVRVEQAPGQEARSRPASS